MILHNDPLFSLYFGDTHSSVMRDFFMEERSQEDLWKLPQLNALKKKLHLDSLIALKQTHSAQGILVTAEALPELINKRDEGDFLVTQQAHTGLGIYTADCLPIVFYDTYNRALGLAHAGWQGSVRGVAPATLELMQKELGTKVEHLRLFFGPSAKVCCYEVQEPFKQELKEFPFHEQVLIKRGDKYFFDLPLFNMKLLESVGVMPETFHVSYNLCTICNDSYCSNRRSKGGMERQLTIVALK